MDEEIKKLVEKNLEVSEEILKTVKYVKNYVFWARVYGFVKVLIIVIPLAIGIIYLPPLIKELFGQYQSALTGEPLKNPQTPEDVMNKLPPGIKNLINR
jgi:hypothetical protein